MEYGIYLFMCGWHMLIFGLGYTAHVAISRKIWKVRGVSFKYAGESAADSADGFAPPPMRAYNPHHE